MLRNGSCLLTGAGCWHLVLVGLTLPRLGLGGARRRRILSATEAIGRLLLTGVGYLMWRCRGLLLLRLQLLHLCISQLLLSATATSLSCRRRRLHICAIVLCWLHVYVCIIQSTTNVFFFSRKYLNYKS